jgi:hypothetical protein
LLCVRVCARACACACVRKELENKWTIGTYGELPGYLIGPRLDWPWTAVDRAEMLNAL